MNKRNLILLICLLSLSTALGCGQAATSQPTATPIPGWEKFEGDGVELWLPESYEGGTREDMEMINEAIRSLGPEFEQAVQAVEQNPSMFIIWAIDSDIGDSGGVTNVSVMKEKLIYAFPIDNLIDEVIKELPAQWQVVERGIVSLENYQAGRVVVEATISDFSVKQLGYYIKDGNTMWLISFGSLAEDFDQRLPVFELSILTFAIQS
ncbi:MAG: hypothetical protein KAI06_01300 [Anaerolineales bacterium]|nr:hypothetical protein [Anaerolineales bacterium]